MKHASAISCESRRIPGEITCDKERPLIIGFVSYVWVDDCLLSFIEFALFKKYDFKVPKIKHKNYSLGLLNLRCKYIFCYGKP